MAYSRPLPTVRMAVLLLGVCVAGLFVLNFHQEKLDQKKPSMNRNEPAEKRKPHNTKKLIYTGQLKDLTVHLAVIMCEEKVEKIKTTLKSAIILSLEPLMIHIIAEEKAAVEIQAYLNSLVAVQFKYKIYSATYPSAVQSSKWRNMNAQCSTLRLFLPTILSHLDSVIFVENDAVFLRPVEDLWDVMLSFSTQHLLGLAYDRRQLQHEYIPEKRALPFFIPSDVDNSLMVMNLTRMRAMSWENEVLSMYKQLESKKNFTNIGYQLLNAVLHFNPYKVYTLDCDWNFRYKMWKSNTFKCETAEKLGVSLIHVGYDDEEIFTAMYNTYKSHDLLETRDALQSNIQKAIKKFNKRTIFWKHLRPM